MDLGARARKLNADTADEPIVVVPARSLWAAKRTINTALLADLGDGPTSAALVAASHAIAFAGRRRHTTQMTVLADRAGMPVRSFRRTHAWLADEGYLDAAHRQVGIAERWQAAIDDDAARYPKYGRVSTAWLAVITAHPDRLTLAATSLAVACLIGPLTARSYTPREVADIDGTPVVQVRRRLTRLTEIGLIVINDDKIAFGPAWQTT